MKNEKLYIQDLEKILGIYRKKLYYWERTNKIPKSHREIMSNYRYWTVSDMQKIKQIILGRERWVKK